MSGPNTIEVLRYENFASVSTEGVNFSADTSIWVDFLSDSLLYSAAIAHWTQGMAAVFLRGLHGDTIRLDTLRGDTLLSNIPSVEKIPQWLHLRLHDFTGSLVIQMTKMPFGPGPPDTTALTDARYDLQIMATLLDTLFAGEDTVFVWDSTRVQTDGTVEARARYARYEMPTIRESTIRSFVTKNLLRMSLRDSLRPEITCLYFPLDDGRTSVQLRHPLVAFSRVGYSADTTQALVYLIRSGQYTEYSLLERQSGRWVRVNSCVDSIID